MKPIIILEGMISVMAALESGNRHIEKIWIVREKYIKNKRSRHSDKYIFSSLLAKAQVCNIPIEFVSSDTMNRHTRGNTAGGVIAFASERSYMTVEAMLKKRPKGKWAALEGFEDPYNYGNAIRSLYAAGFDGIMTARKSWNGADTLISKSSAGIFERMPMAWINDYDIAIADIINAGVTIICAEQSDVSVSLYDADLSLPCLIVVGGEKRGISKAFIKAANTIIAIPYGRDTPYALSGVSAVAVIAFEMLRRGQ